tara:strand:+ start:210 stop:1460 length:1251 start_codon:yes stop_codon:yes gene_type:complete
LIRATVTANPWIPHTPTPKQAAFLALPVLEAMYGGAAGGGKSDALLMGALQYIHVPGYSALLLRKTYSDLALPGALMDRAQEWLRPTGARWDEKAKTWHIPGGGTLTFGYLENERDKYRYQGMSVQFIGFDELTQFREEVYRFLFGWLRRLEGSPVPLRMRCASNPGNIGHQWVRQRFLEEGKVKGRVFIPATIDDNPYLDREEYIRSLSELDPITRRQLLDGDWSARRSGGIFAREWFEIVAAAPAQARRVRYWDLAATEVGQGTDPDWTAGAEMSVTSDGVYYLEDVLRRRATPRAVEALVKQTAEVDGTSVPIVMEEEPGASGKSLVDYYRRKVIPGFNFHGRRQTGSKEVRAAPLSSQAEAGNVKLVRGPWVGDFLDEAELFPEGEHDDMVDAASGAFAELVGRGEPNVRFL